MNDATAVITCEGSDRVITVAYSEDESADGNANISFAFDPPLARDEESLECERGLHFLYSRIMKSIGS